MKKLFNRIQFGSVLLSILVAGNSFANPLTGQENRELVPIEAQADTAIALVKESPDHILLVKNESGHWVLFNGNQLIFPENEKTGFKVIKLSKTNHTNSSLDGSLVTSEQINSGETFGGGSNGSGSPGSFGVASISPTLARFLGKAAPYLITAGKVAASAGLIALGIRYGGIALSVGIVAGLTSIGVPFTTAVGLAGALTMSSGSQSSVLGQVGNFILSKVPFLGSWFGQSTDENLLTQSIDENLLPQYELPDVPTHSVGSGAMTGVLLSAH